MEIRKAKKSDAEGVYNLIVLYSKQGRLLPVSKRSIEKNRGSFFVAVDEKVIGCVCLCVYSKKLAEIRSLAVDPLFTGGGIGGKLVEACVREAKRKKVLEVLVITSQEAFFKKKGFDYILPGERKALFINP
ncbi:GNAT family N-acetyltransferase [Candidatus Micrarchaeota archaeon]|nr:GNAT family N-acetyltransferase [Candidatus Micrarchaeota archaeon]